MLNAIKMARKELYDKTCIYLTGRADNSVASVIFEPGLQCKSQVGRRDSVQSVRKRQLFTNVERINLLVYERVMKVQVGDR